MVNTTQRLAHLRELMEQKEVEAFVIPSEDQRGLPGFIKGIEMLKSGVCRFERVSGAL